MAEREQHEPADKERVLQQMPIGSLLDAQLQSLITTGQPNEAITREIHRRCEEIASMKGKPAKKLA